jgi:glucosamine--fructose-6-phosphate aminotransferase (isomerizing)
MCGIVGAVAERDVVPLLLEGLRRLEYRGYDSAGVAVVNSSSLSASSDSGSAVDVVSSVLQRLRSTGRVANLAQLASAKSLAGRLGIAHTRWATHGVPSERNAHPHVSGQVSVVHNGIIENHEEARRRLQAQGYVFTSDTDTEVIAHLVHSHLQEGCGLLEAVRRTTGDLVGAFAIAVITADDPGRMVVARMGAPLLLGLGDGENFAASDTSALLHVTKRVIYLEDGDVAEVTLQRVHIIDAQGKRVVRPAHVSELTQDAIDLGPYEHFMQKEIFEQPEAVARTLELLTGSRSVPAQLFGAEAERVFTDADGVLILACGTSYHAGLVAKYWLESLAGIPCNVEIASEYRYRDPVPAEKTLVVSISQSGETADTLAAIQHARALGHRWCLSICNVPESALIRSADLKFLTRAGPEIGVASTKAFTTQLAALMLMTLAIARLRGRLPRDKEIELLESMRKLPGMLNDALDLEPAIRKWAEALAGKRHALFLGRGAHYPIALEGALKLKEISYIHAEAYALVDADMPVIAIAPSDRLFEKLKSNLQEVKARGGVLYVIADRESEFREEEGVKVISLPRYSGLLSPIVHAVPLQLLAYHTARAKGTDVDKPRNLAKSVTVE